MTPTYTAKLIADIGKQVQDAEMVTLNSMATGAVGTINYMGQLYEVRVTPIEYGIEKWSHPKQEVNNVV